LLCAGFDSAFLIPDRKSKSEIRAQECARHTARVIIRIPLSPSPRNRLSMPQVNRSPKVFDVCIVGSGAAGGTAAKILTEAGLNGGMVEAGGPVNAEVDFKEHVWPYELPHRGAGVGGRALQPGNGMENEFIAPTGAWTIEGEPYSSAPGSTFRWYRSRIV